MELKDVILSTLAEMEDIKSTPTTMQKAQNQISERVNITEKTNIVEQISHVYEQSNSNEIHFLTSLRERLLVLFEGFQAPNNANIEAKIDMTLNFLEYVLVTIDARIDEIERKGNQ
ncbi:MAG: hypothetical protein QG560_1291 [Campylobacterota bacterium]|nr:hypothetical protein [Campylobacterota bacterium]